VEQNKEEKPTEMESAIACSMGVVCYGALPFKREVGPEFCSLQLQLHLSANVNTCTRTRGRGRQQCSRR